MAADTSVVHSILVHKTNEDKIMLVDSHKLIAASGEPGVLETGFSSLSISRKMFRSQFRNENPLTTAAAANFTHGELATALRKNPYHVNILMAGFDKENGAELYYIDYVASLHKVDEGAFGYSSYFALSLMDRLYHKSMSVKEAIALVDKIIIEIRSRLVVAPPNFVIKIVDKNGAKEYACCEPIREASVVAGWKAFLLMSSRTYVI